MQKCNELIDELRNRLARKYFDLAVLYYRISSYNAAIISFNNLLKNILKRLIEKNQCFFL